MAPWHGCTERAEAGRPRLGKGTPALPALWLCGVVAITGVEPAWGAPKARPAGASRAPKTAPAPEPPAPPVSLTETVATVEAVCAALEYEDCAAGARTALARPDLDRPVRMRLLKLLAVAQAVQGDIVESERAFKELLALDPQHDLPADTAPKIMTVWRKAQADMAALRAAAEREELDHLRAQVSVQAQVPEVQPGGRDMAVRAVVQAPAGVVSTVLFHYRRKEGAPFAVQPLRLGTEAWTASIPAESLSAPKGGALQWYQEVRDERDRVVAWAGDAATPRVTTLTPGRCAPRQRAAVGSAPLGTLAAEGALLAAGAGGTALLGVLGILGWLFPPLGFAWLPATVAVAAATGVAAWMAFRKAGRFRLPLLPVLLAAAVPASLGSCLGFWLVAAPMMVFPLSAFNRKLDVAAMARNLGILYLITAPAPALWLCSTGGCGLFALGSVPVAAGLTGRSLVEGEEPGTDVLQTRDPEPLEDG